jgi:hypothetical protein
VLPGGLRLGRSLGGVGRGLLPDGSLGVLPGGPGRGIPPYGLLPQIAHRILQLSGIFPVDSISGRRIAEQGEDCHGDAEKNGDGEHDEDIK